MMTDVLTPQQRSFNMSRIRNRDTRPEMIVRSILHRLGYRYRLHKKDLPGKPDVVLVRHRKIIDVHGCFFHMHKCRYGRVVPVTNAKFWRNNRLIIGGDAKYVEACSYDMRVGTIFREGLRIKGLQNQTILQPGDIVSLFTMEELDLPPDVAATAFALNAMSSQGILVLNPGH